MIRTIEAQEISDNLLKSHNLWNSGWRTNFSKSTQRLGECNHDSKKIIISILHLNASSEAEVRDTILHEIAHALVGPGKRHGIEWVEKAKSIGLTEPKPCGFMNVEQGRAIKEVERKKEVKPSRKAVQKLCPICGAIAVEVTRLGNSKVGFFIKLECGHLAKEEALHEPEIDIENWTSQTGKKLFRYQCEGVRFLAKANGRALIADEPGLGKTATALGFCYHYDAAPILWVCKTTLKLQTLKEAIDWCGFAWTPFLLETSRTAILPGYKIYVVSMDLLRRLPKEKLDRIGFRTVVADEIQHFKNPDSTRTAELRQLVSKADYFIPLSGTPWKNRGSEYFSVLNMLSPTKFPSEKHFQSNWVDYYMDSQGKMRQGGIRNIPRFKEYTQDIVIRRLRNDVLPDLPPIKREIRFCEMGELYTDSYDEAEETVANVIKAAFIDDKPIASIAAEIMKLKHITGLAKVGICVDDVKEFIEQTEEDEKITIFHHHIDVGNYLQEGDGLSEGIDKYLIENGLNKSLRLYGGRSGEERNRIIEQFKNDPKCRVLIASTLASGEGLNIQFCQNAYMLERQWNPANEEQAELRFSRPITESDLPDYLKHLATRKASIRIPYFIAEGTVDSMLTEIVERKRIAFNKTMNNEDTEFSESAIMQELAEKIMRKHIRKG